MRLAMLIVMALALSSSTAAQEFRSAELCPGAVKTPTRVIGGMVILATQKESALAVVTYARRELERGDAVRSLPPEEVAGL